MIRSGRGAIRPTTSIGRESATRWPIRHSLIVTLSGAKGKAGRPMKSSKAVAVALATSLKPQSSTTARMRGSRAAARMLTAPPSETPSAPMRSGSTSGRATR